MSNTHTKKVAMVTQKKGSCSMKTKYVGMVMAIGN